MHLLDRFSSLCGATYSSPQLEPSFFPLPFTKYITINPTAPQQGQQYDYLNDALYETAPYLQAAGIHVVQVGDRRPEEPPLPGVLDLRGALKLKQMTYILQNSLYHICTDSFCGDLANIVKTPNCQIFGSTPDFLFASKWHDKVSDIISPPKPYIPTFQDAPPHKKIINKIKPETISRQVLNALGLTHDLGKVNTIYTGAKYALQILEAVPDFSPPPDFFSNCMIHLRLDYHFNEDHLVNWAPNRKLILISDKPLNLGLLRHIKPHIEHVVHEVTDDISPQYLFDLKACGLPVALFTKCTDEEELKHLRLKFINWNIEQKPTLSKKDIDNYENIEYSSLLYKSSKILLSQGKEFACKESWQRNMPKTLNDPSPIHDCENFWKELEHFRLIQTK